MLSHTSLGRACVAILGLIASVTAAPCDLYASGGTPCVAAHSTTRALYSAYNGPLYQVQRDSDGTTADVPPLSAGGVANAGIQDTFCGNTTCSITVIYDQSGHSNDLTRAPAGGFNGPGPNGSDNLAPATGAPVALKGQTAYGVFIAPGTGYRNDAASGTATGDGAQGIYAVFDGTHYNDGCCFDYGNAEVSATDTGDAHMEAIYFGTSNAYGFGAGAGPWIMADLENGLYADQDSGLNANDPTQTSRFVTAAVKGEPGQWAIRGGDSTSGGLTTYFSGGRPAGYDPMHKEGAIILGIGGDNSNGAQGTFYEGAMTAGYPDDATEDAVQADVVGASYAVGTATRRRLRRFPRRGYQPASYVTGGGLDYVHGAAQRLRRMGIV